MDSGLCRDDSCRRRSEYSAQSYRIDKQGYVASKIRDSVWAPSRNLLVMVFICGVTRVTLAKCGTSFVAAFAPAKTSYLPICLACPAVVSRLKMSRLPEEQHTDTSDAAVNLESLKADLAEYMEKRRMDREQQSMADSSTRSDSDESVQIIGGTKGNKVLGYVGWSPVKEQVIRKTSNVFDYDELTKYGYSGLITPIMQAGGRAAMYRLFQLPVPASDLRKRDDISDDDGTIELLDVQRQFQGASLLNREDAIAAALAASAKRPDSPPVGPAVASDSASKIQQAFTTAQRLDVELARGAGRASSWAAAKRKEREKTKKVRTENAMYESMDSLSTPQRVFSVVTWSLVALAYGQASPQFFTQVLPVAPSPAALSELLESLQVPATALLVTSLGSAVACGFMAQTKGRNLGSWAVKGFLGGPLTIRQLRDLQPIVDATSIANEEVD
jgi:hypothetical protein